MNGRAGFGLFQSFLYIYKENLKMFYLFIYLFIISWSISMTFTEQLQLAQQTQWPRSMNY